MIFGLRAPLPAGNLVPDDQFGQAAPPTGTAQFAACWLKAWGNGEPDFFGWVWDPYGGQGTDHGPHQGHHSHAHGSGHDDGSGGHHGGFGGHHGGFGAGHGGGGGHF